MNSLRNFILAAFFLTACAGTDVMPKIGTALLKVLDAYVAADRVQTKVQEAAELVCTEPLPQVAPLCPDIRESLAAANACNDDARGALIGAISVYESVNNVLLDDSDAGVP